jgi:uroporphyrin-III C-methyltransferase
MTVHLVGAGPGDPDLLTVRATRLLTAADVLVYDRLITPAILDLAADATVRIDVGKSAGHAVMPQHEINRVLVEHGSSGASVVRLKGGDPYVFGRGGEEAEALIAAGIPFEVVPGITSAIAAPMAAGVPVTMRHRSLAFTVVTGHEDPLGSCAVNWEAHAATGATLVVLMGVGRIATIAERLIAGGRAPHTPVTAVRWGCTDEQSVTRTTLADVRHATLEAPTTIVIGEVAAMDLRSLPHP